MFIFSLSSDITFAANEDNLSKDIAIIIEGLLK
jgi:hypothetical protein